MKKILGLLILNLVFLNAQAENCFSLSPSMQSNNKESLYSVIDSKQLKAVDYKALKTLFKRLKGTWRGKAEGFRCLGSKESPKKQPDDNKVWAQIDMRAGHELTFMAELNSLHEDKSRKEDFKFFLTKKHFRLNRAEKQGDVLLLSASANDVLYMRKTMTHNKGRVVREVVTGLRIEEGKLLLKKLVYTQGFLSSKAVWQLKR